MTAGLTTHVLDTSREGPAEGIGVTLYRLGDDNRQQVTTATTNPDGRVDEPLLDADEVEAGTFEIVFDVGTYYREASTGSTFLEEVPVRFIIADPTEHYHVPLLLSPGGYTTYRGS